jgi:hypothetical protein
MIGLVKSMEKKKIFIFKFKKKELFYRPNGFTTKLRISSNGKQSSSILHTHK